MPARRKAARKRKRDDIDADSILEAEQIKLQPVKDSELNAEDPEEDIDDPSTAPAPAQNSEKPKETNPDKIMYTCIMNQCSEVKGTSVKQSCTFKKPIETPVSGILSHYYLHYRAQGHWDKICPPTNPDDLQRIESYQCSLCGQKFRCNKSDTKSDPEPARMSFLYHYAIFHGKMIDAIREDPDLDPAQIEAVLKTLQTYLPDVRKFITEGTGTPFDKEPFTIGEQCEWKLKQMQSGAIPTPPSYVRAMEDSFKCPFADRSDCKDLCNNRNPGTLKLHLFYHFLDFWKTSVPEFDGTESKCNDCGKRLNALNPSALRTTIICHRAIQHNELKDAIEDSIVEFDQGLFNRLFNPILAPKPKIRYSVASTNKVSVPTSSFYKQNANSNQQLSTNKEATRPILVDNSNKEKTKKKQILKKKDNKRKKSTKFFSGTDASEDASSSESDVEAIIPLQPYVRKRIKQNLSNIDFEEDSDKDEDFTLKEKEKKKIVLNASSEKRPSRTSTKKTYEELDSE